MGAYDEACPPSHLEGGAEEKLTTSKAQLISAVMQLDGLTLREAVLVDDEPAEIASVRQPPICRAVFVRKKLGLMAAEMDRLRRLADPGPPKAPESSPPHPLSRAVQVVPPKVDS